jgi:hypothetical protein
MKRVALFALWIAACACAPKKPVTDGSGGGTGTATATGASCDDAKPAVTALYEAEAKATDQVDHDPSFVDDNVAMVMKDCAKDPARVARCATGAKDVASLEHDCLIPLDEEGSEGEEVDK